MPRFEIFFSYEDRYFAHLDYESSVTITAETKNEARSIFHEDYGEETHFIQFIREYT